MATGCFAIRSRPALVLTIGVVIFTIIAVAISRGVVRDDEKGAAHSGDAERTNVATLFLGKLRRHHCGVIDPSEPYTCSIALRNDSAARIKVTGVDVTCGCLRPVRLPATIDAGCTEFLELSIDAARLSGFLRQRVVVFTDGTDASHSIFQCEVTASVRSMWSSPRAVDFGRLTTATGSEHQLAISALGYGRVRFNSVRSTCKYIHAEFDGWPARNATKQASDKKDVQHDQRIRVRISPESPPGHVTGELVVAGVADGKEVVLRVPVRAELAGILECYPPQVVWPSVVHGGRYEARVALRVLPHRPCDLSQVEISTDGLGMTTELKDVSDSGAILHVRLTVPEDAESPLRASVTGQSGGADVFRVPVLAVVRPTDESRNYDGAGR